MLGTINEILGNVIDRLREPLCTANTFLFEQATCNDPEAIPAPGFALWNFVPISDDQKMAIKEPLCNATTAAKELLECEP